MKRLILPSLLALLSPQLFGATICYFSLNNGKEFSVMQKMSTRLNEVSREKIEVKEFVREGESVEKSFLNMVKSGTKCDGLVISGHHTGSFGGSRAQGTLSIDFMERLSCNPRYKDFFGNVKSLWLQGCRTLGQKKIAVNENADYHADRVFEQRSADGLEQGFLEMNLEFSTTLDEDNPLSSRYLRVFPRAATFGWTATAPGVQSRSEFSIPYHIAQMARVTDDRHQYFDNPVGVMDDISAVKYANALLDILKEYNEGEPKCCLEENSVDAWIDHGNRNRVKKYAFQNPDLNAYTSLISSDNGELFDAKRLECMLKNENDIEKILGGIEEIVQSPFLIGYSINSVIEVYQRLLRIGDFNGLLRVKKLLEGSSNFYEFMEKKLHSKTLGTVRKIDYYAFYRYIYGDNQPDVIKQINKEFTQLLSKRSNDPELIDAQVTLVTSMFKNNIMKLDILAPVMGRNLRPEVAATIASNLQFKFKDDLDARLIFDRLLKYDQPMILNETALAIAMHRKFNDSDREKYFETLLRKGKDGIDAAGNLIYVSNCGVENCGNAIFKLLNQNKDNNLRGFFYNFSKIKNDNLDDVVLQIAGIDLSPTNKKQFVQSVIRADSVSTGIKSMVLNTYLQDKKSLDRDIVQTLPKLGTFSDSDMQLFDRLLDLSDKSSIFGLVGVLSKSRVSPLVYKEKFESLVEKAIDDPKALELLGNELISGNRFNDEERQQLWNKILSNSNLHDVEFYNWANKITDEKNKSEFNSSLLKTFKSRVESDYFKKEIDALIN